MRILRILTVNFLTFLALVWGGAFVLVVLLTFAVDIWKDITLSGWEIAASQISRWVAFWLGVYQINTLLSIAVAHGRTRREFLTAAAIFTVLCSLMLAVLSRAGFFLEGLVYDAMSWHTENGAGAGILEYWLTYAVWTGVGGFIATAFIRYSAGGLLSIPVGIALIVPAGSLVNGSNSLPFLGDLPLLQGGSAQLLTLGAVVVAFALAWLGARDIPIRVRAA